SDGSLGYLEDLADLTHRQILDVAQRHGLGLTTWQPPNLVPELNRWAVRGGEVGWGRESGSSSHLCFQSTPPRPRQVHSHPPHPSPRRVHRLDPSPIPERPQERLLGDVFSG